MKTWLEDNWERWEDENVAWFTPASISTVPSDLLPKKALSDMGGEAGRKASIMKMKEEKGKVGSVRMSMRGSNLKSIPMGGDASIMKMKEEKGQVGRESVRRGSNPKVIPMG